VHGFSDPGSQERPGPRTLYLTNYTTMLIRYQYHTGLLKTTGLVGMSSCLYC